MVTLGKIGTLHARRLANARLRSHGPGNDLCKEERKAWRQEKDVVRILFDEIAPSYKDRRGGYTRILRLQQRQGDAAKVAILEWVDFQFANPVAAESQVKQQAMSPDPQ